MNFKRFHESKNLFDSDTVYSAYKQSDGTYLGTVNNFYITHVKPFTSGDIGKTFTFTMVVKATTSTNVRASANINGTAINGNNLSAAGTTTVTFTVSSVNDYLYLGYGGGGANPITLDNIMLNTGSQPHPYEPYSSEVWHSTPHYIHNTSTDTITTLPADIYADGNNATVGLKGNTVQNGTPTPDNPIMPEGCGDLETVGAKAGQYKIPISSANTTTPVYLGEVESTRRIKKYEFTGQESIVADLSYSRFIFILNDSLIIGVRKTPAFCTHWQVIDDGRTIANVPNNALYSDSENSRWFIKTTDYTTANDLKSYLAAQYAAGTPVTIWYVLATETTGIVNEPLRKIGSYADTVSGITIPTITGKDTFDVETTLKPSEVSLSYTGWHDATVEKWDGSQWQ